MRHYLRNCGLILLLILIPLALHAAQNNITDSEGYACMGADFSRKETEKAAMVDAKRKAAEQVITYIRSETWVRDSQLEKDIIDSYTNGTVKILRTKNAWYKDPRMGECFKVVIKAEIHPDPEGITERIYQPGDVIHYKDGYEFVVFKPGDIWDQMSYFIKNDSEIERIYHDNRRIPSIPPTKLRSSLNEIYRDVVGK
jgi:hypothetical protein